MRRKLLRRVVEVDEFGHVISSSPNSESPSSSYDMDATSSNHGGKTRKSQQNMIVAEFFDEAVDNASLSCYNSRNKVCFMTNDVVNSQNPFHVYHQASDNNKKKMLVDAEFYNDVVIEITAENMNELVFDIKYHFYFIDLNDQEPKNKMLVNGLLGSESTEASKKSTLKSIFDPADLLSLGDSVKSDCVFKCPQAVNGNNRSLKICLDETLVCDGEVNCIYNDYDEINCT